MQTRQLLSAAVIALSFCATGAFAADGCRTIANGVQKCDVPTGHERSREDVVAELRSGASYGVEGCRTIANGVQKCDLPTGNELDHAAVVAEAHSGKTIAYDGCRTIANGVQKCDLPASVRGSDTAVAKLH